MLQTLQRVGRGQVLAAMEPGYAAFRGAFGGWTAAHALLAALDWREGALQATALSIDYLAPIVGGTVSSQAMVLHASRSQRFVGVTTQNDDSAVAARTSVLLAERPATVVARGATMPHCAPAAELPRWRADGATVTWLDRFDLRCAQGQVFEPSPGLRTLFWTRLDDRSPDDFAMLAALADASLPRIYFHFARIEPIATVTMSIYVHADAAVLQQGLMQHVLIEAWCECARGGFFDQRVRLWSHDGTLLATSSQWVRYGFDARP